MPVYQLVGGKCRKAADIYLHADLGAQDPGKQLAKDLEQFRLFFCEDLFSPEEAGTTSSFDSKARRRWPSVSCGTIRTSGSPWCRDGRSTTSATMSRISAALPPIVQDIFQGRVQIKDGYAWINEKPGWGIEVDAALAAKHPINDEHRMSSALPMGASSKEPARGRLELCVNTHGKC